MSLLDHELLLLPVEEFKEYVVDPDAELDFSRSDIDPSLHTIQEGASEIRSRPKSPSMLRTTKSARTKQFRTRT